MRERLELEPESTRSLSVPLAQITELSRASEPKDVYNWGVGLVGRRTAADLVQVAVRSDELLVPVASTNQESAGRERAMPIATSIPGSVATSGERCLVEDRDDVRGAIASGDSQGGTVHPHRSLACAPIADVGVIIARGRAPGQLDEEDLDLLEVTGEIVGNLVTLMNRNGSITSADPLLEEIGNMVSHDLRNKINIATGRLDLAIKTDDEEHLVRSVDALESVERIADVVVSLARTGKPLNGLEDVHLAEAVEMAFGPLSEPNASLVTKASATILADPDCLSQLLENLFRNSIEHSDGEVTIEVGLLANGFYVADDGPGIPAEMREEVQHLGYSTAAGHQGKGLSIVSRMADAHGWEIEITESTSGGTRVEVQGVVFR